MLYIPNLIGYFRIACMVAAFYVGCGCSAGPSQCDANTANFPVAISLYFLNFAGDVVDGSAARAFNQSSKYGGVSANMRGLHHVSPS